MNTIDEIKYFITQKENNGALLLAGKWGCGKTHLVNQVISELNQGNDFIAVSISLFGVDSIELLHKEIKNKVFFSRGFEKAHKKGKNVFSKIKNFSNDTTAILGETFQIAKSINKALNIRWQDFFNVEKCIYCYKTNFETTNCHNKNTEKGKKFIKKRLVLFFDDFERSRLDRIELMGVINEYSENRGIKVIIVADEDKIKEKGTNENSNNNNHKKDDVNITNSNSNDNKFKYYEFKEKLICRTLKIEPEYTTIIDSIINSYEETVKGYKDFLINNKEIIYQIYIESNSDNLRSVKSFIIDYERLHKAWQISNVPNGTETNMFYNFGAMTFGVKMNIYKEEDYGTLFSRLKLKKTFHKWDDLYFIYACENWIIKHVWNEKEFVSEISERFCVQSYTADKKLMYYNLWDLQQSDIEEGLETVLNMAYNGNLTMDQLIDLLKKIHYLRTYSVTLPCNVDYTKMKNGFESRKTKILNFEITEPKRRTYTEKSEIDEEAYSLYDNIKNFDSKMYALEARKNFIEYLESIDSKTTYNFKDKLIGSFDEKFLEMFYNKYSQCNNASKREMCFTFLDISFCDKLYSDDEVNETISNLQELKRKIENNEENKNDCITAIINKSFCDKIDSKISEIQTYYTELKKAIKHQEQDYI